VERRYLRWASETHPGDRKALAERLGVSERTLYRKLRQALEPNGRS
jgi:DNA-binding NtrC family response regulator